MNRIVIKFNYVVNEQVFIWYIAKTNLLIVHSVKCTLYAYPIPDLWLQNITVLTPKYYSLTPKYYSLLSGRLLNNNQFFEAQTKTWGKRGYYVSTRNIVLISKLQKNLISWLQRDDSIRLAILQIISLWRTNLSSLKTPPGFYIKNKN